MQSPHAELAAASDPQDGFQQRLLLHLHEAQLADQEPAQEQLLLKAQAQQQAVASLVVCPKQSHADGGAQTGLADIGHSNSGARAEPHRDSLKASGEFRSQLVADLKSHKQHCAPDTAKPAADVSSNPALHDDMYQSQLQCDYAATKSGSSQAVCTESVWSDIQHSISSLGAKQSTVAGVVDIPRHSLLAVHGQVSASQKHLAIVRQPTGGMKGTADRQVTGARQAGTNSKGSSDQRKSQMRALARTMPTRAPVILTDLASAEPRTSSMLASGMLQLPAMPPHVTGSALLAASPAASAQDTRVLQPLPGCSNQHVRLGMIHDLPFSKGFQPRHSDSGEMPQGAHCTRRDQSTLHDSVTVSVSPAEIRAVKRSLLVHPGFC